MQTNTTTRKTSSVRSGTQTGIVELLRLSVLALGLATPLVARLADASEPSRLGPTQATIAAEHERTDRRSDR